MSKKIICGHSTEMGLQTAHLNNGEKGQEYYWCTNCGALRIQQVKRTWTYNLDRGSFRTILPKLMKKPKKSD